MDLQGKTRFLQKKECCAGALEGRFIATLCRLTGAKTVLEVGMFTGTTTLAVAQQLPADGRVRLARRGLFMFSILFTNEFTWLCKLNVMGAMHS